MNFDKLKLIEPILKALRAEGYSSPTPIQAQAIPLLLNGRDIIGCARTGTGKTAAFCLPILQILRTNRDNNNPSRVIRSLILSPTRELAIQIEESIRAYGRYTGLKHGVVYGGVSQRPQVEAIKKGIDILVATPGRLLDLMNQKHVNLEHVSLFVLDEADRMLDMGFIRDIRRIISRLPRQRQTMLFSATMPAEITHLADSILYNPARVSVTPDSTPVESIEQGIYYVEKSNKKPLLIHILKNQVVDSTLIFTRTKRGADNISRVINKAGIIAESIHGDKSQGARQRALQNFKKRRAHVLVATDVAARGLDIEELALVINFEMPETPEMYVHRIGRTGRAGLGGTAISFCAEEEKQCLKDITRLISRQIPVVTDHPYHIEEFFKVKEPVNLGNRMKPGKRRTGGGRRRTGKRVRA
ncbi:MAG: DEAD/DEAH box helicase [Spirochaetales bacterium]|nr:DEAD/DEAH box helicase [Spirochaetales bacterium]